MNDLETARHVAGAADRTDEWQNTAADTILALCDLVERHRKANLVRAVLNGADPEWIAEVINAEDWDAVPWRVADGLAKRIKALTNQSGAKGDAR